MGISVHHGHLQLVQDVVKQVHHSSSYVFYQILVDIIGLQEVRSIGSNIDVLDVPGFQSLIFKSRSLNRGRGVGFYVRSGISTKIIEKLSVFQLVYLNLFVLSLVIQLVKLFSLFLFNGLQAVCLILITSSVNSEFFLLLFKLVRFFILSKF